MFDIKWIRENPADFDAGMARRGLEPQAESLIALDSERRDILSRSQEVQAERNKLSKEIGIAKREGRDASEIMTQVSQSKSQQAELEEQAKAKEAELENALMSLPNVPASDVPDGDDEDDNVEIRKWGDVPSFEFEAKEHFDIGEQLGQMDFETAAKISGSRFVILSGALARMERALAAYMLDLHTMKHDYTEVNPPALVKDNALYGTGQLPKFSEDLYRTEEGFWMIPTAEVPLTNMVANDIADESSLPRRYTAMTWCFRSEAGSAGKDTRGMIRQHQFSKVEMVSVVKPDESDAELERMTGCAEAVLQGLKLPYRVITLCTGDMGFSARRTFDIEVWLPGQDRYREISSCSTTGDFQARRMKARFRAEGEKKPQFVHTLNGSGLAVGRCLVAVLENYQQADGSVIVPEVLRPYMGGLEVITAN
ncbi:serine--tRNA ligase [Terasakiella sp. SH-1]|uniref:serine--tRNA ligase n=1 Tax=Terasakiella sp. SH-1 TaxID=2560057 RepID=UPI001073DF2D|nr:serine--tRNA ligase [Terasakiella sp. SH-1]